jgi:hypothetical protein
MLQSLAGCAYFTLCARDGSSSGRRQGNVQRAGGDLDVPSNAMTGRRLGGNGLPR